VTVKVRFYSWFKDRSGVENDSFQIEEGTSLGELLEKVHQRYPSLKESQRSTLMAVGLDYQDPGYQLQEDDEVSFFPPVQGG